MKRVRVRLLKDRAGCDGQSSWVNFKGTLGIADYVNHPKDMLHGEPTTVHVWWDWTLYDNNDSEDRADNIYTFTEDNDVPFTDIEFVELVDVADEKTCDA